MWNSRRLPPVTSAPQSVFEHYGGALARGKDVFTLKPQSILQLTIIGFLAVSATLVVALLLTARKLDGLGMISQRIVTTANEAMRYSGVLVEQASAMERNVLQFGITGGQEILAVYSDRSRRLTQALAALGALSGSTELDQAIDELAISEAALSAAMASHEDGELPEVELLGLAHNVAEEISEWNTARLAALRSDTERTRQLLTWQAVGLVLCALVMAGIFTALITRPLLQLERAIGRIGDGSLKEPIRVSGPRDLVQLGGKLDWLRQRMQALEERRSLFLRHISHELKTPLASMQESAALMMDEVAGPLSTEQRHLVDIQLKNSRRLRHLIDDLLRHNTAHFALLNKPPEAVRLDRVLDKVLRDNEPMLRSRKLQVLREGEAATVSGNFDQLRVVFDNLLTNAIRFSPEGGGIRVIFGGEGEQVTVDFRDEGPGVPLAEREDIFTPFFQGRQPDHDRHGGTGLGLAIAREYCHANRARIAVLDSTHGAHFRLSFGTAPARSTDHETC